MKYLLTSAALVLVALAAQPAAAQPPASTAQPTQMCLRPNFINGWKVINNQSLIVYDRVNHPYMVTLQKGCYDLKWPSHLGFSNGTGFGLNCIGHNDFLTVPANGGDALQRCTIQDVQATTPTAAAAAVAAAANSSR